MRPRRCTRAATLLASAIVAVCVLLLPGRATPAEAVTSGSAALSTSAPGFALQGTKWADRTRIDVYYTWAGGTCVLDGESFSGAASTTTADIATTQLRAAIDDINVRLRGALTLSLAGEATRADLCNKDRTRPIVVGWGTLPTQGEAGLAAVYSTVVPSGQVAPIQFARVFIKNDQNFACTDADPYRDLRHFMLHELLHGLGIGHSSDQTAIMAPSSTLCRMTSTLQPDDIAGLAALYPPPPGPSTNDPTIPPTGTVLAAFAAPPLFSATGQALAVFNGGSVDQLDAATKTLQATGVWAQDGTGAYRLYVIGGPTFVNNAFRTAFAAGFAGPTAVTLTR